MDVDCAGTVAWSPDGAHIIATCMTSRDRPVVLWMMQAESGEPTEVTIDVENITDLAIRPDGRAITFTAGNPAPAYYALSGIRWN